MAVYSVWSLAALGVSLCSFTVTLKVSRHDVKKAFEQM